MRLFHATRITLGAFLLGVVSSPALAADAKGCDGFMWPLTTELAWMQAADKTAVTSGGSIAAMPGDKAVTLKLLPQAEVKFPVTPTKTAKPGDAATFAGFFQVEGIDSGHYQLTISSHAWIDVVQNGAPLDATGHTGAEDCAAIRKSVRFEIGKGPFTILISGSPKDAISVALRPAAD